MTNMLGSPRTMTMSTALVTLLIMVCSACTRHVVMPEQPSVAPERPSALNEVSWNIKHFRVSGTTGKDRSVNVNNLQSAFVDYLQAQTQLGPITPHGSPIPAAFEFEVGIHIERDTKRTGILDIVNIMTFPLLFGALTPEWGTLAVSTDIRIVNAQGKVITTIKKHGYAPYSMTFFGWYRSAAIEQALSLAYTRAFKATSRAIAQKVDEVGFEAKTSHRQAFVEALLRPSPPKDTPPPLRKTLKSQPDTLRAIALKPQTKPRRQRSENTKPKMLDEPINIYTQNESTFGFIDESPVPIRNPWYAVLRSLGGIERGWFWGRANVTSGIIDENGQETEVANGKATREGRRITLYTAPKRSGFNIYPIAGYLQQTLTIEDFYEEPPQFFGEVIGTDIEAICKNEAGEYMSCQPPTRYALEMESFHAGFRAGYNLVFGWPSFRFIASCNFGLNVIEHRSVNADLEGIDRGTREGVDFLQSSAFGGTLGFHIPALHLTVRGIFDWEYFRAFKFEDQIEFMGPVVCNPEIGLCQRSRALVDSTHLTSWSAQVALAVVF